MTRLTAALNIRHVAVIMDGNRRWAKRRHLPTLAGHGEGVLAFKRIVEHAGAVGLQALTAYAFSTENWRRDPQEVSGLMGLFLKTIAAEVDRLATQNVRLRFIGDLAAFSPDLGDAMRASEAKTGQNNGLLLQVAVNYGGRAEIVAAARALAQRAAQGELSPQVIGEDDLSAALTTAGAPDPDLVIRTAGESRLSNFLLWQAAYAEFYASEALWPDFSPVELNRALLAYARRERRYGG
ncbi:MAG: di-trans,poly-cis-decaprenylcistransferase [Vampirovibrionales bacterium]|nr:di-trans,poly-cis-decaprenylcistransferase [Vampirovibrionales bacterium]